MKKILNGIMLLCLALSLVACGGGSDEPNSNSNGNGSQIANNDVVDVKEQEILFDGLVVVDNENCKIEITQLEPDNAWGFTLKVVLENKSADKTFMYSLSSVTVNGVQTNSLFASEVAPGKKANESIYIMDSDLEKNGIVEFTDIELVFRVYDSNDWSADDVAKETVHVYPFGEDKATVFSREPKDTDKVIVDNEAVTVILTNYGEDDFWGYTLELFMVNKTDTEVMFTTDDESINGFMVDAFFAKSVVAGKSAFATVSWSDSMLEENGIETVEEIEFNFRAYDAKDWLKDDFANELITITP